MTEVTAARKSQQNRSSLCSDGFTALHGKNAFVHFSVLLRLLVTSNLLKPNVGFYISVNISIKRSPDTDKATCNI